MFTSDWCFLRISRSAVAFTMSPMAAATTIPSDTKCDNLGCIRPAVVEDDWCQETHHGSLYFCQPCGDLDTSFVVRLAYVKFGPLVCSSPIRSLSPASLSLPSSPQSSSTPSPQPEHFDAPSAVPQSPLPQPDDHPDVTSPCDSKVGSFCGIGSREDVM